MEGLFDIFNDLPCMVQAFDPLDNAQGIKFVGIVGAGASEVDMQVYNQKLQSEIWKYDEKRGIFRGIMMRANHPMLRFDGEKYFYAYFVPEYIELFRDNFMKHQFGHNVNIDHNHTHVVEGVYLVESFMLTDANRVAYPEFKDCAAGSWVVSYKVDNKAVWDLNKKRLINSLSPEIVGSFISIDEYKDNFKDKKFNNFNMEVNLTGLSKVAYEALDKEKFGSQEIEGGTLIWDELEVGQYVWLQTADAGVTAPLDGEYVIEGKKVTLAESQITAVEEIAEPVNPEETFAELIATIEAQEARIANMEATIVEMFKLVKSKADSAEVAQSFAALKAPVKTGSVVPQSTPKGDGKASISMSDIKF